MATFVFEGYQIGYTFWGKRPFVKDIRGQKTYFAPLNVHRCYQDFIAEIQKRKLPKNDEKFALEYTTSRYISTVIVPSTFAADMFTNTSQGRFVDQILASQTQSRQQDHSNIMMLEKVFGDLNAQFEPRLLYTDDQVELAYIGGIEMLRATHLEKGKVVFASPSERQRLQDLVAMAREGNAGGSLAPLVQHIQRTFTRALLSGENSGLYQILFGQETQVSYHVITTAS
jgi:hypothetical protein